MDDDDAVFKALPIPTTAPPARPALRARRRTLADLEAELDMTRFGVMKHLRVLEDAGLVVTRRAGREKLHFLNPVPIRLIHDRWIDKYTERRRLGARSTSRTRTGGIGMTTTRHRDDVQVYHVFISATPEQVWAAITQARVHAALLPRRARSRSRRPAAPHRAPRRGLGRRRDDRVRPAATARARVALALRPGARRGAREPRDVGDRAARRRRLPADAHPRPARGLAEDGRERRGHRAGCTC